MIIGATCDAWTLNLGQLNPGLRSEKGNEEEKTVGTHSFENLMRGPLMKSKDIEKKI